MTRQLNVMAVSLAVAACGGNGDGTTGGADAGSDVGAGGTGVDASMVAVDVDEMGIPEPGLITPENGGTIRSASGLLEIVIPKGAVSEPVQLKVVRLRGADIPLNAMGGIAHTIAPLPPNLNGVATAIWTIPAATTHAAFGTGGNRTAWPLPVMGYQKNSGSQPLGVRKYERFEDGGFRLTSYAPSPPASIYLSTDHAIVTLTTVNPVAGELGSVEFTVSPAPGSMLTWVGGSIGSVGIDNWNAGGKAVESDDAGGLTGYFRGTCGSVGYTAAVSFELKTNMKVGVANLEYNAWMGGRIECPH